MLCGNGKEKVFFLFDGTQYIKIWTQLVLYLKLHGTRLLYTYYTLKQSGTEFVIKGYI